MKLRTLAVLVVITVLCCAGCLQELPLGDKYINEAVGLLRVQNTSTEASYVIIAVELRNSAGEVIKTWEGLGKDGQGLQKGEIWIGDLDLEGFFTLYCTVQNKEEGTTGTFNHGAVEIKLHEIAESGITGEVYLSTADTDKDGFSDFWETNNNFNPNDPSDGGTVYVSSTGDDDDNRGTAEEPYQTLTKALEKARWGLNEKARTIVVGLLTRSTEDASDSSIIHIGIEYADPRGFTIVGKDAESAIDAKSTQTSTMGKRALYLGPGVKLTLKNLTIRNGYALRGAGIHAEGAELTLGEGVVIQNCNADSGSSSGGGVLASNGARVLMKNGSLIGDDNLNDNVFTGNTGWRGTGVALLDGSSLTMENGSRISGNRAINGGAVDAELGSTVTLKEGAEIINNNDERSTLQQISRGGGVSLGRGSKLIMEGGLIANNIIARGSADGASGGGGVYINGESEMEMKGGEIRGNIVGKTAGGADKPAVTGNGGGVYVDTRSVFRMTGGLIAGNTATGKGGGVYVDGGNFFKDGGTVYGSNNTTGENKNTAAQGGHAFAASISTNNTLPVFFTYP
jgi:hypothetical protein